LPDLPLLLIFSPIFAADNITYTRPEVPSLMSMLSMGNDSLNNNIYGKQTASHILQPHDVMDLMVINFDANAHPFHLHGYVTFPTLAELGNETDLPSFILPRPLAFPLFSATTSKSPASRKTSLPTTLRLTRRMLLALLTPCAATPSSSLLEALSTSLGGRTTRVLGSSIATVRFLALLLVASSR
jgi:hypothetical protein